jgi:hypothetical protein
MRKVTEPLIADAGCLFRSAYSPRVRVSISFTGEGRAKQSFKDECDINRIMARYLNSGILPEHLSQAMAQFVDCTGVDFQEAQLLVSGAKSLFAELPSAIRSRFHHSPEEFLVFAENPVNGPALVEMGLATLRKDSGGGGATPAPSASPTPAPASGAGVSSVPEEQRGTPSA